MSTTSPDLAAALDHMDEYDLDGLNRYLHLVLRDFPSAEDITLRAAAQAIYEARTRRRPATR